VRLGVFKDPDSISLPGTNFSKRISEVVGFSGVRRMAGRQAARDAPGRDRELKLCGHGAHERLESLLLDCFANDERILRTEENREIFGRNVQVKEV
jgi:hypothetical protein